MPRQMNRGNFNTVFPQTLRNLIRSVSRHSHIENTTNNSGSLRVYYPILPLFVPQIPVTYGSGQVLSAHTFGIKDGFDLTAGISGVVFVHEVQQRQHEFRVTLHGIDVVVNGDQADAKDAELIDSLSDFQMVTSKTAHVLHDNSFHAAALDILHHVQITGAVKAGARDSVIGEVLDVGQFVFAGVVFQLLLLIGDRVGFARLFVLMAEAFVKCGDFRSHHICKPPLNVMQFIRNGLRYATFSGMNRF